MRRQKNPKARNQLARWAGTLTLLALSASLTEAAQLGSEFVVERWSKTEGLNSTAISAVTITPDGYVWLGSEQGLIRFDGLKFTTFDTANTPGLANSSIRSLFAPSDGSLWIGALHGVLTHRTNSGFNPLGQLPRLKIISLYQSSDGRLWIGTSGAGLFVSAGGHVNNVARGKIPGEIVYAITPAPDGTIWIGTDRGLTRIRGSEYRTFTNLDGIGGSAVHAIAVAANTVWIGTELGLTKFENGRFQKIQAAGQLPNDTITSLLLDHTGSLWIGTLTSGIRRYADGQFTPLGVSGNLTGGVLSMFEDESGKIWLGRTEGGLAAIHRGVFRTAGAQELLASDMTTAVFQDRTGTIWVGSDGGVSAISAHGVRKFTDRDGLPDKLVLSIAEDATGFIWVGTHNGLARFDGARFHVMQVPQLGAKARSFLSLYRDNDGILWAGSRGALTRWDGKQFTTYSRTNNLPDFPVIAIHEDQNRILWIGTDGGGLVRLENGHLTRFGEPEGLPSASVWDIYPDKDGSLWLATDGSGLVHFRKGKFNVFSRANGLLDDEVFSVLEDSAGRIWMTSNRGPFFVRKSDLLKAETGASIRVHSTSFGVADGVRDPECNGGFQPAAAKLRDGRIALPTVAGLITADPSTLTDRSNINAPVLESVSTGNEPLQLANPVHLPLHKRDIEFHFTAPYFRNTSELAFRYYLEGYDRDWIDAGSRRDAFYTHVPPGRYVFHLEACATGNCTELKTPQAIVIEPLFYETKWFAGIVVVLVCGTVLFFHRLHVRKLNARESRLLQLVNERTRELRESRDALELRVQERTAELTRINRQLQSEIEVRRDAEKRAGAANEAKSQFLANMSHEIRTPINGIMGMAEILSESISDSDQRSYLGILRGCTDDLLGIVNSILDFSSIEHREMHLDRMPFQLSECLERPCRLAGERARAKQIDFEYHVQPGIPDLIVGDGRRLAQVLLNVLDNAVKFTSIGSVNLGVHKVEQHGPALKLRFEVKDTGIGIQPEKQALIFQAFAQADTSHTRKFGGTGLGLAICNQIVALMNGQMGVQSEPGCGSTFWFTAEFGYMTGAELLAESTALQI